MAPPKGHGGYEGCGRPREYTAERFKELAADFVKYADKYDSIVYRGWACTHKKGQGWIKDLVAAEKELIDKEGGEPYFYAASKYALARIGQRREEMALNGQFKGDTSIVKATLATYDIEHRELLRELKKPESAQPTQVIIERKHIDD